MTEPAAPLPGGNPAWVSGAVESTWRELRLYLSTLRRVLFSPGRFARAWADGDLAALNPLGFTATGAALVGFLTSCVITLAKMKLGGGLLGQLLFALAPYLYYGAIGAVAHVLLFSRVRSFTTSVALALYAGGAAAMVGMTGGLLAILGSAATGHVLEAIAPGRALTGIYRDVFLVSGLGGLALFPLELAVALRSTHRVGWLRALAAVVGAVLIVGLLGGWIPTLHVGVSLHGWHRPTVDLMW